MGSRIGGGRYDVVVAGARCAGASIAMLLARRGLDVLVVDPVPRGRDTLSTHALMRGAVMQLHRWGLLDAVRASGAPRIGATTFHYGDELVEVPIKERDGVDGLYAPRRTVLDPILVDAAREAGAEIAHGYAIVDLIRDPDGRVRGARVADRDRDTVDIEADLVIGADGMRSRVARLLDLEPTYVAPESACAVYGYWQDVPLPGYHWFFEVGLSIGTIPTNADETCVFVLYPATEFEERRDGGLDAMLRRGLRRVSPELSDGLAGREPSGTLRGYAGAPGFLRPAVGPGWALVGDAAYFKDPITAHGITDALREAELLARALTGGADRLHEYGAARDRLVRGFLDVTHRIASFDWDLESAKEHHLELARQMNAQVDVLRELD